MLHLSVNALPDGGRFVFTHRNCSTKVYPQVTDRNANLGPTTRYVGVLTNELRLTQQWVTPQPPWGTPHPTLLCVWILYSKLITAITNSILAISKCLQNARAVKCMELPIKCILMYPPTPMQVMISIYIFVENLFHYSFSMGNRFHKTIENILSFCVFALLHEEKKPQKTNVDIVIKHFFGSTQYI